MEDEKKKKKKKFSFLRAIGMKGDVSNNAFSVGNVAKILRDRKKEQEELMKKLD